MKTAILLTPAKRTGYSASGRRWYVEAKVDGADVQISAQDRPTLRRRLRDDYGLDAETIARFVPADGLPLP